MERLHEYTLLYQNDDIERGTQSSSHEVLCSRTTGEYVGASYTHTHTHTRGVEKIGKRCKLHTFSYTHARARDFAGCGDQ